MSPAENDIARILYLDWQDLYNDERPFQIFSVIPKDAENQKADNLVFTEGELETMHDMRGKESEYTLDRNGFFIRHHTSKMMDFSNEDAIKETYIPEIEALLKAELEGIDQVHVFDYRVRPHA
jgi:hypothetical protein